MTDQMDFEPMDTDGSVPIQIEEIQTTIDVDGDGVADIEGVAIDVDGDGVADIEGAAIDVNGDGVADLDMLSANDTAQKIWGDMDKTEV